MKCDVGLDVSQDECAICVLSEDGKILFERSRRTDPDVIMKEIGNHGGAVEKIVCPSSDKMGVVTR